MALSKGEQTRRAVLDAAISRFARDGYRPTSVADIARDAAVGGTVPYAYFPNKEALFFAAVDEDAAAFIQQGLAPLESTDIVDCCEELFYVLVAAVDKHPLAKRLLANLEPEVAARVIDIPALMELRKVLTERLRAEQVAGSVRADVDPVAVGNGLVMITISLLRSVVQLGSDAAMVYASDVIAVFEAAVAPIALPK
jgi:AcrR family transcriptional regulator